MAKLISLNWEQVAHSGGYLSPKLPTYEAHIGNDKTGRKWLCRVKYREQEKKFMVAFDWDDGESTPFLRDEVIYADNYWTAHKTRYFTKWVDYEDIRTVVLEFINDHGLKFDK